METPASPADLRALHARRKMELLARDPRQAGRLGRLVAQARGRAFPHQRDAYLEGMAEVLRRPATVGRNVNALLHLLGHIRNREEAARLTGRIEAYRRGEAGLGEVKRDLRAALVGEGDRWAATQTFLGEG